MAAPIHNITKQYSRKYRRSVILIILITSIVNILSLIYSYLYKHVIDNVIDGTGVASWLGIMLLSLIVNTLLTCWIYSYYLAVFKIRIANDVRYETFKQLMLRPFPFFRRQDGGSLLIKLLDDPRQMADYIALYYFIYIGNTLRFLITCFFLLRLNLLLTIAVLLSIPFYYLSVRFSFKKLTRYNEQERSAFDAMSAQFKDQLDGIKTIKANDQERFFVRRLGDVLRRWFERQRSIIIWNGLVQIVRDFVKSFMPLAAIALGVWQITEGNLTVGGLVAFLALMDAAYLPVDEVIFFQVKKANSLAFFNRNAELHQPETALNGGSYTFTDGAASNQLILDSLHKQAGERVLYSGLSYRYQGNGLILLEGDNGSGKTTMLHLLKNMESLDSGRIGIASTGGIAYLPQESHLFMGSLRENVYFDQPDLHIPELDFLRIGPQAEAAEKRHDNSNWNQQLSGGERRKLMLQRIFSQDKGIWLLDEPEKELDQYTIGKLYAYLEKQKQQRLIVLVSHHQQAASLASAIVSL